MAVVALAMIGMGLGGWLGIGQVVFPPPNDAERTARQIDGEAVFRVALAHDPGLHVKPIERLELYSARSTSPRTGAPSTALANAVFSRTVSTSTAPTLSIRVSMTMPVAGSVNSLVLR